MGDRPVHFRRTIQGRLDMGWPAIPPLPAHIALTHRTSGTVYYLTTNGTYPTLNIVLDSTPIVDRAVGVYVYGAFDGPVLNGIWRLFVDTSGFDIEPLVGQSAGAQTRVFGRNAGARQMVEITAPGGVLTYTNVQF